MADRGGAVGLRAVRGGLGGLTPYDWAADNYSSVYSTPEDEAESEVIFGIARREVAGGTLIDVGCGDGIALAYLGDECDYIGVDPSAYMIHAARRRWPSYQFEIGTLAVVPSRSADFVLGAFGPLIHIEDAKELSRFAREVERVLWPGSRFLVMGATRGVVRATGEPRAVHSPKMLTAAFASAGLLQIRVRGFGRRWGATPNRRGRWAPQRLLKLQKTWGLRAGMILPGTCEWLVVSGAAPSR